MSLSTVCIVQNSHDSGGYRSVVGGESIIRDIKACQTTGNAHGSSPSNQFRDQSAESSF